MLRVNLIESIEEIESGLFFIKESPALELKEIYKDSYRPDSSKHIFILKDNIPESDLWIVILAGILKTLTKYKIDTSEVELTERCSWTQLKSGLELHKIITENNSKEKTEQIITKIDKFSDLLPLGHLSSKRALTLLRTYYSEVAIPIYEHHLHTEQTNDTNKKSIDLLSEIEKTNCDGARKFLEPIKEKLKAISRLRVEDCKPEDYLFNLSTYCLWLADQAAIKDSWTSALILLHRACDTLMQSFCVKAGIMKLRDKKVRLREDKSDQPVYLSTALDLLPNADKSPIIFSKENAAEIRKINGLRNECIMAHGEKGVESHLLKELILETKELFNNIIGNKIWTVSAEIFSPARSLNIENILLSSNNAIPSYFKYGIREDTTLFNWNNFN